jgi:DMSO reductase anchor subunit
MPTAPAILIPARRQTLWSELAVANFVLGGVGAGFYLAAVLAAGFRRSPAVALAAWLAPALVAAGFAAVAMEAGRPFRGARVLARVRTSWMSRELWIGGAFIVLAAAEPIVPAPSLRALAAGAAVGLVLAQGSILRGARGVTAWNVALMPVLFLASAVLSGFGALALAQGLSGRPPDAAVVAVTLALLPVGFIVWLGYLSWSAEPTFLDATRALRAGAVAVEVVALGYVLPFVAAALALALPGLAPVLAPAGAALLVVGHARAKWVLLREAGALRPITLPLDTRGAGARLESRSRRTSRGRGPAVRGEG